eukprot:6455469-Amphidinium_carterae.1
MLNRDYSPPNLKLLSANEALPRNPPPHSVHPPADCPEDLFMNLLISGLMFPFQRCVCQCHCNSPFPQTTELQAPLHRSLCARGHPMVAQGTASKPCCGYCPVASQTPWRHEAI